MSSTLPMSWAAWVDSWLNSMLSITGSSWRQNFLWTNFNSFNNLIIRVLTWKYTRSDVDIISVNLIHCGNRLLQVACCLVHFKDVFRTVLNFRQVLAFLPLFPKARYVRARSGMLLLALPILSQRYLARWPWSFKSFEKCSISTIWCHTINAISRYCCVGHTCKRLRLPEFQSKILRFWQSYPEYCMWSWFPRCNRRTFLWNCQITMSSFLLWVISKRICKCQETAWRALSFSFPPGIHPYSNADWSVHECPLWYKCFFHCWEIRKYPIEFGSTAIPPECPWIARQEHMTPSLSLQDSILFIVLPSRTCCDNSSLKSRAPSYTNFFLDTLFMIKVTTHWRNLSRNQSPRDSNDDNLQESFSTFSHLEE